MAVLNRADSGGADDVLAKITEIRINIKITDFNFIMRSLISSERIKDPSDSRKVAADKIFL